MTQRTVGKGMHPWICKWWLRMRDCKRATLIGDTQPGVLPVQEFYVPLWAWPFEWMHRCVFGNPKLTTTNEDE